MTVFVDTGIFVALHNADDTFHLRSKELVRQALNGDFGRIYTSDYVIDEAVTTALVRTKKHDLAQDLGSNIISSARITKIFVTEEIFQSAWNKFVALKDRFLSFTDCTSLAIMETKKIKQILSFDSDFDGLTKRIS